MVMHFREAISSDHNVIKKWQLTVTVEVKLRSGGPRKRLQEKIKKHIKQKADYSSTTRLNYFHSSSSPSFCFSPCNSSKTPNASPLSLLSFKNYIFVFVILGCLGGTCEQGSILQTTLPEPAPGLVSASAENVFMLCNKHSSFNSSLVVKDLHVHLVNTGGITAVVFSLTSTIMA